MYVYIQSESNLWTVGYYHKGAWYPESDHDSAAEAAARVSFLNGSPPNIHDNQYKAKGETERIET